MVEEAEKKLYDIVLTGGDVAVFRQLLQEEPCLLERASFLSPNKTTPLHIAALYGNLGIVEEVLRRNRVLARQLDFQKSSPLHIAVAEGHVRISSLLFSAAPNMCWQRDCQGMNPVHIAAMKGNIEILNELIGLDCSPAREKVDRGQTVLHLCVKHDNLKALEVLVESLPELVSVEDDDGNTILHLATRCLNYKVHMARNWMYEERARRKKTILRQRRKTNGPLAICQADRSDGQKKGSRNSLRPTVRWLQASEPLAMLHT